MSEIRWGDSGVTIEMERERKVLGVVSQRAASTTLYRRVYPFV